MLSQDEKYRYHRHLILQGFGEPAQDKLKNSSVLVVGAGGLGCPVLQYLAAAGVGRIGIVDDDTVDVSNLQRQILYTVEAVGRNKAIVAVESLEKLNPHVRFEAIPERLTVKNACSLFAGFDVIVDGTDNFSSRYLINDAAVITGKPVVYGSIFKFEGQLTVFNYNNGPTYRCLFPEPPEHGTVPNCAEIGVIGILPGIIGTHQANEVIKIITGIGKPSSGKLLLYNALNSEFTTVVFTKNEPAIQAILQNAGNFENNDYELFCGKPPTDVVGTEIDADQFRTMLEQGDISVLDVREDWETPVLTYSNQIRIPLPQLDQKIEQIPSEVKLVVICQSGVRSMTALKILHEKHNFRNLVSLKGGMANYAG